MFTSVQSLDIQTKNIINDDKRSLRTVAVLKLLKIKILKNNHNKSNDSNFFLNLIKKVMNKHNQSIMGY